MDFPIFLFYILFLRKERHKLALFKIAKGSSENINATIPTAVEGFCYFNLFDKKFYIDTKSGTLTGTNPTGERVALNANVADYAARAGYDINGFALNPFNAQGQILYASSNGNGGYKLTTLNIGQKGQVLKVDDSSIPTWSTLTTSDISDITIFVKNELNNFVDVVEAHVNAGTIYGTGIVASINSSVVGSSITTGNNISSITNYKAGWEFRVISAGLIADTWPVEPGDWLLCIKDSNSFNTSDWTVIQNNLDITTTITSDDTKVPTAKAVMTYAKPKQTAVANPAASGSTTSFIDTISQNTNGVITVTKKNLDTSGTWTGNAKTATGFATAKTITLTGNVTGSATGGNGDNGWSIATTIASIPNGALPLRLRNYQSSGFGDANEATESGFHYMTTAATNRPPFEQNTANKDYRILTTSYSSAWVQQIATDFRSDEIYFRRCENGTWKNWVNLPLSASSTSGNTYTPLYLNKGLLTAGTSYAKAIKSITRSGTTFTYTCIDGTTGTFTQQDNNTTYSAGTGISFSGTTINHKNSITADTASGDATKTLTWGGTFTIPSITYDAQGHITGKSTTTMTMPANPTNGLDSTYLKKAGDTASGNIGVSKASGSVSLYCNRSDTSAQISLMVGSSGTSKGIWDNNINSGSGAWLCYTDGTHTYFGTSSAYGNAYLGSTSVYTNSDGVLMGAAWNDYAEYRISDCQEPGRVICENGDDTLSLATERLQPAGSVISDTFGFAIGETETAKTPIAVSGRVLVYPYEDRYSYNPGDAVCAAPGGTVSKMTREEIITYPERIIGTVSAIPEYETWGEGNVPVNGRIWIKVK